MSSTTEILAKWQGLKRSGFDLGAAVGPEQDAGSGGRVHVYQNGRIYWHSDPSIGAHEVHGGILGIYLRHGGPGDPAAGSPKLGFPISDEVRTQDGLYPISHFQFGDIIWLSGTGGLAIYGEFFQRWLRYGRESGALRYPITEPVAVAGGEAVYFERLCLWKGPATDGRMLMGGMRSYTLGCPRLIDPGQSHTQLLVDAAWLTVPDALVDQIHRRRPALYSEVWAGRLFLQSVPRPGTAAQVVPLAPQLHEASGPGLMPQQRREPENPDDPGIPPNPPDPTVHAVYVNLVVPAGSQVDVQSGTLYNLCFRLPNGNLFTLMPHGLYAKGSWQDFGFAHITDLHVSRRNDGFYTRLKQVNPLILGAFVNPNDVFRRFVRYANQLHDAGQLDMIIATGDLVDYIYEDGDPRGTRGGNFELFERLIRGQSPSPNPGVAAEELRVPIFMVRGNHDYRLNPYGALFQLGFGGIGFMTISRAGEYNLTDAEMEQVQGGNPVYSFALKSDVRKALAMLAIETRLLNSANRYYATRLAPCDSYIVEFGPHRLVMADGGPDAGIPHTDEEMDDLVFYVLNNGNLPEDTLKAITGAWTNLEGYSSLGLSLVEQALRANTPGLVIIGSHGAPMHIAGSEFDHYFRETEHPTADPALIADFLNRQGSGARDTWPCDTPYFKVGTVDDLLDAGIVRGGDLGFLRFVAGDGGVPRSADLVLAGHNHKRVESRVQADASDGTRYYMDFYTENPPQYYPSRRKDADGDVYISVVAGARAGAKPGRVTDHRVDPPVSYWLLSVPPYATPLNTAQDKRAWWAARRPLVVETASLGGIDMLKRGPTLRPPFQGFRVAQVKDNTIAEMRYVCVQDLWPNDAVPADAFKKPWLVYYSYTGTPDRGHFGNGGAEKVISGEWDVYKSVFSGGPGLLFCLKPGGDLSYYTYSGLPDAANFGNGGGEKPVSHGWNIYTKVFSGGPGLLFCLKPDGDLVYYTYRGLPDAANFGNGGGEKLVSHGWNIYRDVFSGGPGVLFCLKPDGGLAYYWYRGLPDVPNFGNGGGEKFISGEWNAYKSVFSGGPGILFALKPGGELSYYSFNGLPDPENANNGGAEQIVGPGWNAYDWLFSGGPGILFCRRP